MSRKILRLQAERNLKNKEIRLLRRNPKKQDDSWDSRAAGLIKGAVWLIADASVPFDAKRHEKDIKSTGRTCLCLNTPSDISQNSFAPMAPGTGTPHKTGKNGTAPVLRAEVPPEDLDKTTYFLLYFRWNALQKTLIKRRCDLSADLMRVYDRITGDK